MTIERWSWRVIPLSLLVLVSDSAAQDKWPAKGDSVHIAASFKDLSAPSNVPLARTRYDMPPCVKLRVVKSKPAKERWAIEDSMGGKAELRGAWLSRMHKDKMECEAQLATEGEPALERSGDTFILSKKAPK